MAITEVERLHLYEQLVAALGKEAAVTMSSAVFSRDWDHVATQADLADLRAELADLRGELGDLRGQLGELRGEFGELRGEFGELRGEFGELRGELRGELHDSLRQQTLALVGAMVTISGLTFAATALVG